jgi:hypothetical protein
LEGVITEGILKGGYNGWNIEGRVYNGWNIEGSL